ncbi:hypothetical protein D9M68_997650 [compost metagenome]
MDLGAEIVCPWLGNDGAGVVNGRQVGLHQIGQPEPFGAGHLDHAVDRCREGRFGHGGGDVAGCNGLDAGW